MLRYLFGSEMDFDTKLEFDCIIVGGGMAGLYAALCLDDKKSCALITKDNFEDACCSSRLAQGGIAAVLSDADSFEAHISDTLTAGAGCCNKQAVEILVKEGPDDIRKLISLCVPFDTKEDGTLRITREGGHSARRIVHCGGDATGQLVTRTLTERVKEKENIQIYCGAYLIDILTKDNKTIGVALQKDGRRFVIYSSNVIIATGGIGQLYRYSTNPPGTKGEGIAACMRAGAKAKDMEFVQFHPTSLSLSESADRMFLVSEAVRGEGGILRNAQGQAFMENVHPLKDLAPRDIVTRGILAEMKKQGTNEMYLDVSCMSHEFFKNRFPTIYAECVKYGVDVPSEPIPIRPTQHYLMGGIETDLDGKTCVEGLYVAGEAACTGVQGANRLASNSTLECLVFARRAANSINASARCEINEIIKPSSQAKTVVSQETVEKDAEQLRFVMTNKVGALRRQSELAQALEYIEQLQQKYSDLICDTLEKLTLVNAITVCREITAKAIQRKESVGSHYMVD